MGRRKFHFHLSDMMPNAWFYKLRDMRARGRRRGAMTPPQPVTTTRPMRRGDMAFQTPATARQGCPELPHRASYYYTTRDREVTLPAPPPAPATIGRCFPLQQSSPPRNCRRRHRVGPVRGGHAPAGHGLVPALSEPVAEAPGDSLRRRDMCIAHDVDEPRRAAATVPVSDGLHGEVIASKTHIIIDLRGVATPVERVLRPIVTRPATARSEVEPYEAEIKHVDPAGMTLTPRASSASERSGGSGNKPRRSSSSAPSRRRLKTRANSPRMAAACRKGKPTTPPSSARKAAAQLRSPPTPPPPPPPPLMDSFAVVKSSEDPRSDFLDSMAEMIAENGIRDPADLEDLLACYLSLNAVEYHGTIVDAFEQIWTSLTTNNGSKP